MINGLPQLFSSFISTLYNVDRFSPSPLVSILLLLFLFLLPPFTVINWNIIPQLSVEVWSPALPSKQGFLHSVFSVFLEKKYFCWRQVNLSLFHNTPSPFPLATVGRVVAPHARRNPRRATRGLSGLLIDRCGPLRPMLHPAGSLIARRLLVEGVLFFPCLGAISQLNISQLLRGTYIRYPLCFTSRHTLSYTLCPRSCLCHVVLLTCLPIRVRCT